MTISKKNKQPASKLWQIYIDQERRKQWKMKLSINSKNTRKQRIEHYWDASTTLCTTHNAGFKDVQYKRRENNTMATSNRQSTNKPQSKFLKKTSMKRKLE